MLLAYCKFYHFGSILVIFLFQEFYSLIYLLVLITDEIMFILLFFATARSVIEIYAAYAWCDGYGLVHVATLLYVNICLFGDIAICATH
jgi:hypothetical protein